MLRQQGFHDPDPRIVFIDDLINLIKTIETDPHHFIILMLDANESLSENEHQLRRIIHNTSLVDAFTHHTGESCDIATYDDGRKRIDYIFTSNNLLPFIEKVGYLAFGEDNIMSDHRGLFIDIKETLIENKIEFKRPAKRHIGSKSKSINIFNDKQEVYQQFVTHNIVQRAEKLMKISEESMLDTSQFELELNNLDKQVTEIIISAERKSNNRMPECEWSIAIHQRSILYKIWTKVKRSKVHNYDINVYINKLLVQLPFEMAEEILIKIQSTCPIQELKKLVKYKQELTRNASRLRANGLQELLVIRKEQGKKDQATSIKIIKTKETTKQDWKILQSVFKNDLKSSLGYIETPHTDKDGNLTNDPDQATKWQCISDPEKMEHAIIERNIKHFGQAQGTVFTNGNLTEAFGYDGTSSHVNLLLQGNFDIASTIPPSDRGTTTLLQKLSDGNKLAGIDDTITFREFKSAIKKWKEKTSTSPSGRHLGHYKVLLANDMSDKYNLQVIDPKEIILTVYYHIAIASLNQGISIERWHQVITSMIKKSSGCSKINKLRVIHLYEADYNLLLKILWARKLVWHAHDNKRLNSGQSGSRPGCNAIDIVISKEMKYLYSRLSRTALATMDNDAKSCYDRIICNLAMIISQYFGMSNRACQMQSTTLRKMQFRLRTAIGDSINHYSHTPETPIHGTGQGSCASPAIWLTVSSILMDCLSELAGGMTMTNVTTDMELIQWINGFVDDTSLFCNISDLANNDIRAIKQKMMADMIIWQELLEASGGKLELTKCFYYILTWTFDSEGNATHDTIEQQSKLISNIQIPQIHSGNVVDIEQKEPDEAHKTLGCYKSMTGCENAQIKYLQDKANRFAVQVKNAKLTRKQARMAYNGMFIPSLRYGLSSCSISLEDIEIIQKYPVQRFLSAMGYDKKFPRAIVFAHQDFGGLNIPHLYTQMMGLKLESLLSNIRANTELGIAMMININTIQLISGISTPIFESSQNIDYIDNNWLLHLRSFLIDIGGKIEFKDAWNHQQQRQNDVLLMDKFIEAGYTRNELKLLNNWRKFFQVNTLSDICEPEEITRIQACFLTQPLGKQVNKKNRSKLYWPTQTEPGIKGFKLWYSAIKNIFQLDKKTNQIQHKLGMWTSSHLLYNDWSTYYDIEEQNLISHNQHGNNKRNLFRITTTSAKCEQMSSVYSNVLPSSCIPTILIQSEGLPDMIRFAKHTNYAPDSINNKKTNYVEQQYKKYLKYHRSLPLWKQVLVKYLQIQITDNKLHDQLTLDNKISLSTDGGIFNNSGTFGVCISNGTSIIAENMGKSFANEYYQSSFRSELYGVMAGLITIQTIYEFYQIDLAKITHIELYCDNLKVVERIRSRRKIRRTTNQHCFPDYDIEQQLLDTITELESNKTIIRIKHIPGHQDKVKPIEALSHPASLNIHAHKLCIDARKTVKVVYHPFPNANANFTIHEQSVYAMASKIAIRCYHNFDGEQFLKNKYAWSESATKSVWWAPHASALNKLLTLERITIQKFIHNRLPTKKRENYKHKYKSNICTQCSNEIIEDENHILRCRISSRALIRKEWIQEISTYLTSSITPVNVKDAIVSHLHSWLEPSLTNIIPSYDKHDFLDNAISMQYQIGWNNFIRGRLAKEWGRLITRHLQITNPLPDSAIVDKWATNLIDINFKYIILMWTLRNKEEHGETVDDLEQKKQYKLMEEVRHIKTLSLSWHDKDLKYVQEPIEELASKTSTQLELWLIKARIIQDVNKLMIAKSKADGRRKKTAGDSVDVFEQHDDNNNNYELSEQQQLEDLAIPGYEEISSCCANPASGPDSRIPDIYSLNIEQGKKTRRQVSRTTIANSSSKICKKAQLAAQASTRHNTRSSCKEIMPHKQIEQSPAKVISHNSPGNLGVITTNSRTHKSSLGKKNSHDCNCNCSINSRVKMVAGTQPVELRRSSRNKDSSKNSYFKENIP